MSNELKELSKHVTKLMLSNYEEQGNVGIVLAPFERALIMDALALYVARIIRDPEASIFSNCEARKIMHKINIIE